MYRGIVVLVLHTLVWVSEASSVFKKDLKRRRDAQENPEIDSDLMKRLAAVSDLLVAEQFQITPVEALERLTLTHPALTFNLAEIQHYSAAVGIAHRFPTWAHDVLYDSFGRDSQVLAMHAVATRISEERQIPEGFARIAATMWINFCVQFEVLVNSHPELRPYRSCHPNGEEYVLDQRFRDKILERHVNTRRDVIPSFELPTEKFAMQLVTLNRNVVTEKLVRLLAVAEKAVPIAKIEEFRRVGTALTRVPVNMYWLHLTKKEEPSMRQISEVLIAIHDFARQSGLSPEIVDHQMYVRQMVWIPRLIEYLKNPVGYLPCFLSREESYFIASIPLVKETLNYISG